MFTLKALVDGRRADGRAGPIRQSGVGTAGGHPSRPRGPPRRALAPVAAPHVPAGVGHCLASGTFLIDFFHIFVFV